MSFLERQEDFIIEEMEKLKDKIYVDVYTDYQVDDAGERNRKCSSCESAVQMLQKLSDHSSDKLILNEISVERDEKAAEENDVNKIPTIVLKNGKKKEILRYIANPRGNQFPPFIRIIQYLSGVRSYYEDTVKESLRDIPKSTIEQFVTLSCPKCPQVVPITGLVAILSDGKVHLKIVDVNDNPDIAMEYTIQGVPHTIINSNKQISGMFNIQDLLETLTAGHRDLGGMYA
ncbi:MAG: thioredoxin domain-containing protein [Promethearchaeia archaeon]